MSMIEAIMERISRKRCQWYGHRWYKADEITCVCERCGRIVDTKDVESGRETGEPLA